ncbi:MAG: N-acetylmuramoyl-L-alanine amidase [bacterium]
MLRGLVTLVVLLCSTPAAARPDALVVVLDAGHGGSNKGAVGVTGALEKRVTLQAAQMIKRALDQLSGFRVVMTRTSDTYLTLSARVRRANAARGHLFVSLHCNASPKHNQRGFEAFVQSPGGLERQQRPLATRTLTVKSMLRSDQAHRLNLAAALGDLGRRGLRRRAVELGRLVIAALQQHLGSHRSRGLQQARFDVLMGLKMPAVLVEMGFIDHPTEGSLLPHPRYLTRIVRAVTAAVGAYGRRHPSPGLGSHPSTSQGIKAIRQPDHPRKDRRRPDPTKHDKLVPRKPEVALDEQA